MLNYHFLFSGSITGVVIFWTYFCSLKMLSYMHKLALLYLIYISAIFQHLHLTMRCHLSQSPPWTLQPCRPHKRPPWTLQPCRPHKRSPPTVLQAPQEAPLNPTAPSVLPDGLPGKQWSVHHSIPAVDGLHLYRRTYCIRDLLECVLITRIVLMILINMNI